MRAPSVLIALALATAASAAAALEPLDFKGLRFGSDKAAILKQFPAAKCIANKTFTGCLLVPPITYAGEPATLVALDLANGGTLQQVGVTFKPDSFDAIVAALTAKYGPPKARDTGTATSRIGVKLPNEMVRWEPLQGTITIVRYSESIDTGFLSIESVASLAAAAKARAARSANAKGDI